MPNGIGAHMPDAFGRVRVELLNNRWRRSWSSILVGICESSAFAYPSFCRDDAPVNRRGSCFE